MQAVAIRSEQSEREVTTNDLGAWRRRVTYQLILCGHDGCVLASDQREHLSPDYNAGENGEGARINSVKKVRIDPTGRYAWAFSGGKSSIAASGLLEQRLETSEHDQDIRRLLRECGNQAWNTTASGPDNTSKIILADGQTNTIIRANISPVTTLDDMQGGRCVAGQTSSKASVFPDRFYSNDVKVESLAVLAAYAVYVANKIDPLLVDGLDLAIYRNTTGCFEFADSNLYWKKAGEIDQKIAALFRLPK